MVKYGGHARWSAAHPVLHMHSDDTCELQASQGTAVSMLVGLHQNCHTEPLTFTSHSGLGQTTTVMTKIDVYCFWSICSEAQMELSNASP